MGPEQINSILRNFSETDEIFISDNISFDSIVTYAGLRILEDKNEKIKLKLFFYGEYCRGYYNLPEKDIKNLQVFGMNINNDWILKCVTKLNMEEAGGYLFFSMKDNEYEGIWSNGGVNFKKGFLHLFRQDKDYNIIADW